MKGVGLHTGKACRALFRPAPANAGIRFFRADLPGVPMVPARLAFVSDTHRGTTLALGEARVHTVEHVLSACVAQSLQQKQQPDESLRDRRLLCSGKRLHDENRAVAHRLQWPQLELATFVFPLLQRRELDARSFTRGSSQRTALAGCEYQWLSRCSPSHSGLRLRRHSPAVVSSVAGHRID